MWLCSSVIDRRVKRVLVVFLRWFLVVVVVAVVINRYL